ncbi:uncharacterized protein LOC106075092 isoform X2 [Biomphalaria glabrata]|nr:uncharacterized protein LOC106075092 isoform X2 [Biomphalaria glabrata]
MRVHILIFCFVAVLIKQRVDGLEVCDVLQVIDSVEWNLVKLVKSVNATLSKYRNCKCDEDAVLQNEWKLAFRGTSGTRQSVYYAYKDGLGIPSSIESGCKQVGKPLACSSHYRNDLILDNWNGISEVALALYKNDVRVHHVIFDAAGSTYMNWLDKARVKSSSWSDLPTSVANIFSIAGHQDASLRRTFFLNKSYGACPNDSGWFVAIDNENGGCSWEKNAALPFFKYATGSTALNWNDGNIGRADYFAVLVKYYNTP